MPKLAKETHNKLNAEQRKAVEHGIAGHGQTIAGPLLVIAGAGTGKTKILIDRIVRLIESGVGPSRILVVTFTNKAAREIEARVRSALAASGAADRVGKSARLRWSGTFHAVGAQFIRTFASRVGLLPTFSILDRKDAEDVMDMARHELGFAKAHADFPKKGTCLAIYSRVVNSQKKLRIVLRKHYPTASKWQRQLRKLFAAYAMAKHDQNVVDFDDLLLYWLELMREPKLGRQISARFDHVLVDEFQDTNVLQAEILSALKPDGRGVTVVGDEAQAIYSFRAAEVRNILDFPKKFNPRATVINIKRNYRSTQPILDGACAVINLAPEGFKKDLRADRKGDRKPRLVTVNDHHEEAAFVAGEIEESVDRGRSLKRQAVIVRASRHSAALEMELARRGIKFQIFGGTRFTEAAHVKNAMAVMRWAENPKDILAGMRVLKLVQGIGPVNARKVLDSIMPDDFVGSLKRFELQNATRAAHAAWRAFVKLMRQLHGNKLDWPAEIEAVRLAPFLSICDGPEDAADLEQLQTIAGTFKSRRKFLSDLALEPPTKSKTTGDAASKDDDGDCLTISTIHSAKGLEWASVYVLNAVEGGIPSSMASGAAEVEEERRLLYVAMTRAMTNLTLTVPRCQQALGSSWQGDGSATVGRSRFIPDRIVHNFERIVWRAPTTGDDEQDGEGSPDGDGTIDLGARVAERWQTM